jgi:hypothetical protein
VSKKTLSGIRFVSVESEPRWKRTTKLAQPFKSALTGPVPTHLKFPLAGYADLDLIAFLQTKRFDNCGWKPNGKAISPFCYLHGRL